jgi:hypothetical protein
MIDRYSVMVVAKFPTVLMTGEGVIVRVILSEHLAAEIICDCGCLKALDARERLIASHYGFRPLMPRKIAGLCAAFRNIGSSLGH